ncbi:MAG: NADPH-dependent aldehyde reductase Ahr [Terrimicrobiaceae bacterium]
MSTIRAYASESPGGSLKPFEYSPAPLGPEEVEIAVSHCGICHSDLSMINNEWAQTQFPLVPGHEVAGTVVAAGAAARRVKEGDRVGLGWFSESCMSCPDCMSGNHNLCPLAGQTIVGRHGGFAERVRCHWSWAVPLPAAVDPAVAGPLFCGGITVFNPIVEFGVRPTDRVGVIGIGGLGHLAVKFLHHWGCEVIAFSSNPSKKEEILKMGAHRVVDSRDSSQMGDLARSVNFIISTVNVTLDWNAFVNILAPEGRLHFVGAVLEPLNIGVFPLIIGQRSVSGTPLGSPATTSLMLEFCARHQIAPTIETFPMSKVNEALAHLESGKARYRIVLEADF